MPGIHNNLSADTQNVTGAYVIIMLVNNALTWQSSCVIANNARKTAKASYLSKAIISCNKVREKTLLLYLYHVQARFLCDVISRSRNKLSSPSKVQFTPC